MNLTCFDLSWSSNSILTAALIMDPAVMWGSKSMQTIRVHRMAFITAQAIARHTVINMWTIENNLCKLRILSQSIVICLWTYSMEFCLIIMINPKCFFQFHNSLFKGVIFILKFRSHFNGKNCPSLPEFTLHPSKTNLWHDCERIRRTKSLLMSRCLQKDSLHCFISNWENLGRLDNVQNSCVKYLVS